MSPGKAAVKEVNFWAVKVWTGSVWALVVWTNDDGMAIYTSRKSARLAIKTIHEAGKYRAVPVSLNF